jgi:hypothetical protein
MCSLSGMALVQHVEAASREVASSAKEKHILFPQFSVLIGKG